MKIGVTGTREGLTEKQIRDLIFVLQEIKSTAEEKGFFVELHHGDCVGADDTAARLAFIAGFEVVCHPPIKPELRAHAPSHTFREPKGYLERDRNIVDETQFLIVMPKEMEWQSKGGTWYTHDYAKKIGKPFKIIWPK